MSVLLDITALEAKKKELDSLFLNSSLDIKEKYKIELLKEEMLNILSNIFSAYSINVISDSFYLQVDDIEKQICELIIKKNEELNIISKEKDKIVDISKKVITYISSAYILENDIYVGINIEKRLLDIKNDILNLRINNKRLCALSFIESRLEKYTDGLKNLIEIISENKDKSSISFEKRQEIFDIFKNISLNYQIDKNHSKMFNENITDLDTSANTVDYIEWYENIFLQNCNAVGLNLSSYYLEISNYLKNEDISIKSIIDYIDEYILKKYTAEINLFHRSLNKAIEKSNLGLEFQLSHCYDYNKDFNFDNLLVKIESDSYLLDLFDDNNNKDMVKKLHYRSKISNRDNVILYNVLDELNILINKNFNNNKYLEIYMANSKYKNKQIAGFRDYFLDILEQSKKELIKKYIERIEKLITSIDIENYNIDEVILRYTDKENEIEELNQALTYINENYRDFNEQKAKLYFKAVEDLYSVSNLYEKIFSKNSSFIYRLKSKRRIKNELPYIKTFIDNDDLKNNIKKLIIDNIIVNESLIDELKNSMI